MSDTSKVSALRSQGGFAAYRSLVYGDVSMAYLLWAECLFSVLGPIPGAAGIWLRSKLYPHLFGACGGGLVVGRNVTVRHPKKIKLGQGVIIDEGAMIDAKGEGNEGIVLEDGVFIGRGSIVYCKGGNITIRSGASLSSHCTIFSSNELELGANTVVGAYAYLLSGGEYDMDDITTFAQQSGKGTVGPLRVGDDCWIGTRVTILDGACVGDHSVVGAGAVVTKPLPGNCVAVGVPAKVVKEQIRSGA